MQLNIRNSEAYRLAKEIADRTGESLTEAVTKALRERGQKQDQDQAETKAGRLAGLKEVVRQFDTLPMDDRKPDEIVGYDQNGLPS